jgi:hypothetical protein
MDQDPLIEGRRRRRALMAEIECSRDEFEARWQGRAELLANRFQMFRLGLDYRQYRKTTPYPPRNPMREEGWHDPAPLSLPPGNPFPWERGGQSHEWKATEAGTKPYRRRPFPWERQK